MLRRLVAVASAILLAGCSNNASPTAAHPTPTAPGASPIPSPSPASNPLLVFVKHGSVALATPDGSVLFSAATTLDSGEFAQGELRSSDAALIGHYLDAAGSPISPLQIGLLDRSGHITTIGPSAAAVFSYVGVWGSPVVYDGHDALIVQQTSADTAQYVKLDLVTGDVTVLLSVKQLGPQAVTLIALGTSADSSLARVLVRRGIVAGQREPGAAYFEIDLNTLAVSGPHALPDVGPVVLSADGRYAAWTLATPVSGSNQRDLYIQNLVTGQQTTIYNVRFLNQSDHTGIQFSPDDAHVALEGYGGDSQMGFEIYDVATNDLVRSTPAGQPDASNTDVPMWWADSNTVVYQATDASGTRSGHRLEIDTGDITDYPDELGAPVLMLG